MQMTEEYQHALSSVGVATLSALGAMEAAARFLHPPEMQRLREWLQPHCEELAQSLEAYRKQVPPAPLESFHERFAEGADLTHRALDMFVSPSDPGQAIFRIMTSLRTFCRACETLYSLHRFPPLSRFFVEPPFHDRLESLEKEPPEGISVGLHHTGGERGADSRGGFCLYVPESYDGGADWPLVIALHGGSGNGRDFLWSWLREARGRRFLLAAATARGSTWSLAGPDVDSASLRAMVEYVASRWRLDRSHVLLTGLSDGATYALLEGLADGAPYTHLAPVSGVLHPANFANGNMTRARGRKIYLVHGKLDWMFPVELADAASTHLQEAGAELVYRPIDNLSHTYPREENDSILAWFDERLRLPAN
ncbi:MAG TPA: phospholipase [Candidatus Binatia bacterium]|nr:phospholipase [Candidatus Binatia bacterium]